jgi:hypothetical protein
MSAELAANAARALERYKAQERELEAEIATLLTQVKMVRDFIAALTFAPPPSRKRRMVEGQAIDGQASDAPEPPLPPEMEIAG